MTVLFCDVVESTALGEPTDPEVLRAILARYFARMKVGMPVALEDDDALRACRAAGDMRDASPCERWRAVASRWGWSSRWS